VKGGADHSIEHDGLTYRFVSMAARERFKQEAARYRPWSNGKCPVTHAQDGVSKQGEPRWGVIYAGRLFVCASESNRRRFLANPELYAAPERLGDDRLAQSTSPFADEGD
jgi:YHS domain-containing protein